LLGALLTAGVSVAWLYRYINKGPAPLPGFGTRVAPWTGWRPPEAVPEEPVETVLSRFTSAGREIEVEEHYPREKGRRPAVIVLHDGAGLWPGERLMRWRCRDLARSGYVALLPHYYDQTQTEPPVTPEDVERHFVAWMGAVSRALDHARGLPRVDPRHLGLVGWTLGCSLALEVAATDPCVTVVVGYNGGMDGKILAKAKRVPPALLFFGESEPSFNTDMVADLTKALRAKGGVVESHVYPGAGYTQVSEAARDALLRTHAFLDQYLKPPAPAKDPALQP
jgi:dienelactone hydrolase